MVPDVWDKYTWHHDLTAYFCVDPAFYDTRQASQQRKTRTHHTHPCSCHCCFLRLGARGNLRDTYAKPGCITSSSSCLHVFSHAIEHDACLVALSDAARIAATTYNMRTIDTRNCCRSDRHSMWLMRPMAAASRMCLRAVQHGRPAAVLRPHSILHRRPLVPMAAAEVQQAAVHNEADAEGSPLLLGSMTWPSRTHGAGTLREADVDQRITVCGWVDRNRNMGGLGFLDVRDHTGLLQVGVETWVDRSSRVMV